MNRPGRRGLLGDDDGYVRKVDGMTPWDLRSCPPGWQHMRLCRNCCHGRRNQPRP